MGHLGFPHYLDQEEFHGQAMAQDTGKAPRTSSSPTLLQRTACDAIVPCLFFSYPKSNCRLLVSTCQARDSLEIPGR
jgi:hypothetical protein